MKDLVQEYISFQKQCPSTFHVVNAVEASLSLAGFEKLDLRTKWSLKVGKNYWVTHGDDKTIIAFCIRDTPPGSSGYSIIGAHTDSPHLRLRLHPWQVSVGYQRLLTEIHGGLILRSWLDNPLILAGMAYKIKRQDDKKPSLDPTEGLPQLEKTLVCSLKPIGIIPDLAIHLDREKNSSGGINPETMMTAFFGCGSEVGVFRSQMNQAVGLSKDHPLDGFELSLAPYFNHCLVGGNEDFICGPRHDDLAMVFCAKESLTEIAQEKNLHKTAIAAFFDAEETGSVTASGASACFMRDILERIEKAHPNHEKGLGIQEALHKSFFVSADMAHGFHPSFADKHDENHRPLLNGGIVIKQNVNDRYATTGQTAAMFKAYCDMSGSPYQRFVSRQDIACGSTIGPILSSRLGVKTVDVGLSMWGMHSSVETMGSRDLHSAFKVFKTFYRGY